MAALDLGRVAYEAYVASCGGRSVHGELLPPWTGLPAEIREHWRAAADAVLMLTDLRATADPDAPARRAFRAFAGMAQTDGSTAAWEALPDQAKNGWRAAAASARQDPR